MVILTISIAAEPIFAGQDGFLVSCTLDLKIKIHYLTILEHSISLVTMRDWTQGSTLGITDLIIHPLGCISVGAGKFSTTKGSSSLTEHPSI